MSLIKSISGIRGTIGGKPGDGLSPLDVVKFTAAYAAFLDELGYQKSGKDLKRLFARALKWAVDNQCIRRMSNGTLMLTSF